MQLLARDIMQRELIVVTSEMDIREAAKLLLDNEISGAPVVDDAVAQVSGGAVARWSS